MAAPWNDWWHCIGTLKYAWLRGDARGWRARHHREHVEGDYKRPPPPGTHESQWRRSIGLMRAVGAMPRMLSDFEQRAEVCRLLAGALEHYEAQIVDLSVGAKHYHVLVRFASMNVPATGVAGLCEAHHFEDGRDPVPRYVLGKCHSWVSREFRAYMHTRGIALPHGGLFAARPKCIPTENRAHQLRAARYIFDHLSEGAAVFVHRKSRDA